jgi:hypothetical protein
VQSANTELQRELRNEEPGKIMERYVGGS